MSETPSVPAAETASLLFYKKPEPLFPGAHGELALKRGTGFGFSAQTNAVPVMGSEFPEAGRFYPIVFAGETPMPCVVLGLDQRNLFVGENGHWREQHYIPAYVRRYPFVFFATPNQGNFLLGIDRASEQLVPASEDVKDADPLFIDGKPSPLTDDALRFSSAMQTEHQVTLAFAAALRRHDLLVPRQANVALSTGRHLSVPGFLIVDAGRFQALPDAVVLEWHQKGWLAWVHHHLASQTRWADLLAPQAAQDIAAAASESQGKTKN